MFQRSWKIFPVLGYIGTYLLSCDILLSLWEDATLLQTKLNNFTPQFTGASLEFSLHFTTWFLKLLGYLMYEDVDSQYLFE